MNRLEWMLLAATLVLATATAYFMHDLRDQQAMLETRQVTPAATDDQAGVTPALTSPGPSSPPVAEQVTERLQPSGPDPGALAVARLRLERWHDPQFRAEETRKAEQSLRQLLGEGVEVMPGMVIPGMELPPAEVERVLGPLLQQALRDRERQLECATEAHCDATALEAAMDRDRELQLISLVGADAVARNKARAEAWQAARSRP